MQTDFFCAVGQDGTWQKIDQLMNERQLKGGVYRVHAMERDAPPDGGPSHLTPMPRILGVDPLERAEKRLRDQVARF